MPDCYLYIIRCRDGTFYTGITTDVNRRFAQHQGEKDAGSKYLKGRGPLTLVFQERIGERGLALKVEHRVKKLSKARKERLIKTPGQLAEVIQRASSAKPARE
jgi:putative endonuclease